MAASFEIYKYCGKDCAFGNLVSSIGIKRIDSAVPAVYGMPVMPGDDKTDANTYCIYRPDDPKETAYSFESVFKLKLKEPPSTQLSNIRIYPAGDRPSDEKLPVLSIGCSPVYTRPTNTKSLVAVHDIWSFSKENPFYVTVGGTFGQYVSKQVPVQEYRLTVHDIGMGDLIYLNEERQVTVDIVKGREYTFVDYTHGLIDLTFFDSESGEKIEDEFVEKKLVGARMVTTLKVTEKMLRHHPKGLRYGAPDNAEIGGFVDIIDLSNNPTQMIEYEVGIAPVGPIRGPMPPVPPTIPNFPPPGVIHMHPQPAPVPPGPHPGPRPGPMPPGPIPPGPIPPGPFPPGPQYVYTLNGMRQPNLNFLEYNVYKFINPYGNVAPLRFLDNPRSPVASRESEIVIDGITVVDGATENEVIYVNPSAAKKAGHPIMSYQSTRAIGMGGRITNINTSLCGKYNMDTVNGGTADPNHAGETDYIYLQLSVPGDASVGQVVPDLVIEYDEN
jgi:hypothetical protein